MRIAILSLVLLAGVLGAADLAIPAKGTPAFTITVPAGWSVVAGADGSSTLLTAQKNPHIQLWAVSGKRSVDEAVADLATILTPQGRDFVIVQRTDTTVAGAKAQLLVGTGTEADDGDASNAQATVFTVAGGIWVLISHGEGTGAAERAAEIATVLKTVTVAR